MLQLNSWGIQLLPLILTLIWSVRIFFPSLISDDHFLAIYPLTKTQQMFSISFILAALHFAFALLAITMAI